jgi:hypothetical protein
MNDFLTTGNGEMTTSVGAGISLHRTDWDWGTYTNMMAGTVVGSSLSCPVCVRQKSKDQVVCQVCFQNILDSRNGAYPDRWSKQEQSPTAQQG